MVATQALLLALLAHATLSDARPVDAAPSMLKVRGTARSQKRDNRAAIRAKYERNVARILAAEASGPTTRTKRSTGTVELGDFTQQGVDSLYFGNIQIGTPAITVPLDFDTGSSDLWVAKNDGETYDLSTSTSLKSTGTRFQETYGSGRVIGTLVNDVVSAGGLSVQSQYFGAVTQLSSSFYGTPSDGIMGLAFPSIATDKQTPFFFNLVNQKSLDANLFGFYLARGGANGSELTFGATDARRQTGDTYYTPVTSQTYWEVQSTGLTVNNATVGSAFPAAIDTGTTLLYVPTTSAAAFYAQIPGAQEITLAEAGAVSSTSASANQGSGEYVYPCNTTATIGIGFSGTPSLSIDLDDLNLGEVGQGYCEGGIMGMDIKDATGQPFAIVGDLFLKSWYSTFDADNLRVGFTQAVHT